MHLNIVVSKIRKIGFWSFTRGTIILFKTKYLSNRGRYFPLKKIITIIKYFYKHRCSICIFKISFAATWNLSELYQQFLSHLQWVISNFLRHKCSIKIILFYFWPIFLFVCLDFSKIESMGLSLRTIAKCFHVMLEKVSVQLQIF